MDLKQLKYFTSVYESGSFNSAAKLCFIAQPSISAAIAHLESELNQTLFVRHARGISATEHGQRLYPLAKQLLSQASAIKASFTQQTNTQSFSLGVTKGLGVKRMSTLLKEFISTEQQMALTLVPPNAECDARIIIKEELHEQEQFHTIWQEEYLLALPSHHPLALQDKITLSDLDGLDFIQRTPCSAWQMLSDTLTLSGIELAIRANIQTIDYALGLVKAGLGGALVPAHPEVLEHDDISFKAIDELALKREVILAFQSPNNLVEMLINIINSQRT